MREPPTNLATETLRACLLTQYGLAASEIAFLPLGHDASAWAYRVRAEDSSSYFLKARLSITNEAGLLVPRHLQDQGIRQIVAPLPARDGTFWTPAGGYAIVLYPFVEGENGMQRRLSARQWTEYGALLRQIHATRITPDLVQIVKRDTLTPDGAAAVRRLDADIGTRSFNDQARSALASFWQAQRPVIRTLLERVEALGRQVTRAAPAYVLCHADIHTGNVLAGTDDRVWIVDWDETVLAPRERDLMFVVGGISRQLVGPRDEARFFEGYGPITIDPLALAYYRYDWAVADIGAFGEEVCYRPDLGPSTRAAAVTMFRGLFDPGNIVELALSSSVPGW